MKNIFYCLGVLFLLLFTSFDAHSQKKEEKLVKKAFDNYKYAILNDEGENAVQFLDSRTIQYYEKMLELVKTADSLTIETLSILDKLMVFSVRHRTTKEDIMSFDGKLLIVYAIKEGMVGKNSVANVSIGEVIIEGDFAKGQLVSGEKSPFYFHFYKEDANWKLDLTSIFDISNISFQKMAKDSEEKENDFLFNLLEMLSGKKPDSEIWLPTIQK